jgi:hypothetical protein
MRLDRNENPEGTGKYALLKLRVLEAYRQQKAFGELPDNIASAIGVLDSIGALDWGYTYSESEFFVIRLKDKHAYDALMAYAKSARKDDEEWAADVADLGTRAGANSQFCKTPD